MQKNQYSLIKKWIKDEKAIDVVLFGSSVRGKVNPNDLDFCIIIKDSDEKRAIYIVDALGKLTDSLKIKAHISIITSSSFLSGNTLAKTILSEGFSIKKNIKFSSIFGFQNKSLFVYTLKNFSPSKRVKFHYLLKGRYGAKGILKEVEGKFIGTGSIIVPTEKEDVLKEVFETWGVNYSIERVLLS